jgi:peptidoglycan hydrolase-like protein with peptidoglycan-binding domain
MPLRSTLFAGDLKLQAAADVDAAHIMFGARGDHVAKIQTALNILDDAGLSTDSIFGNDTAKAVLAYKQTRGIINTAYQTTADNIVGRMTVARMDEDLFALDQKERKDREPMIVQPIMPFLEPQRAARPSAVASSFHPMLSFAISSNLGVFADVAPPAPASRDVIITHPNANGAVRIQRGGGGTVTTLVKPPNWSVETAVEILNRKSESPGPGNSYKIESDDEIFYYKAASKVGKSFFIATHPTKKFEILNILTLTKAQIVSAEPIYPPHPKSSLISVEGTPLNPLPGKKINIYGEWEANGFTDYGADIEYCATAGSRDAIKPFKINDAYQRPWTADPRPEVFLQNGSVENICFRGSPVKVEATNEIRRIAKPGGRITFCVAVKDFLFMKEQLKDFIKTVEIEDDLGKQGFRFGVYRV